MWEIYAKMWEEQIGYRKIVGFDFSGREIHKDDYNNVYSNYGWTLLPFEGGNGEESYLVVHNDTAEEFPSVVEGEFEINGKLFEMVESDEKPGTLEISEIVFETTETLITDTITIENDLKKKKGGGEKNYKNKQKVLMMIF